VAATQGRGFWILDDLHTLRQTTAPAQTPVHLYAPADALMLQAGGGGGAFEGSNPPRGAVLYYHLTPPEEGAEGDEAPTLGIEIFDASGTLVRHYASDGLPSDECVKGNEDQRSPVRIRNPAAKAGLNRWVWDFRRDRLHCIPDVRLFAGWDGPHVPPGDYRVRLSYAGATSEASLRVLPDPRYPFDEAAAADQDDKLDVTVALMNELMETLHRARMAREGIHHMAERLGDSVTAVGLETLAEEAVASLDAWESSVTQPKHETFEDDLTWPNMLDVQVRHLIDAIDGGGTPVTAGALERLSDLEARWDERRAALDAITGEFIEPFNAGLREQGQPHVIRP
jgi:hypothetical protein